MYSPKIDLVDAPTPVLHVANIRPVRWLVSGLVWAGWCWFVVRGKHCWLAGLGWLKPISEQSDCAIHIRPCLDARVSTLIHMCWSGLE